MIVILCLASVITAIIDTVAAESSLLVLILYCGIVVVLYRIVVLIIVRTKISILVMTLSMPYAMRLLQLLLLLV